MSTMPESPYLPFDVPSARDAEAAICRRDPTLPALACLLGPNDGGALARLLAEGPGAAATGSAGTLPEPGDAAVTAGGDEGSPLALPSSRTPIATRYLRYKPGTSLVAAFEWRDGQGRAQRLHAKALSEPRHAQATSHPRWRTGPRPTDSAWDERPSLGLALRLPAQDRALRACRRLFDPGQRAALLQALGDGSAAAAGAPASVLRHKPGRRLVMRLGDADSAAARLLRVSDEGSFDAALLGAQVGAALGGPRLIATDAGQRLSLVGWVPGRALEAGEPTLGSAPWQALGAALVRLHRDDLPACRRLLSDAGRLRTRRLERAAVGDALNALAAVLPAALPAARSLAARLGEALSQDELGPVPIHGDLAPDQAVWTPYERLVLIDWDRATLGDAAADLGALAARIWLQAIEETAARHGGRVPAVDRAAAAHRAERLMAEVEAGYRDAGGCWPDAGRRARQTAQALMLRLGEPFRRRVDGWPAVVAAMLDEVAGQLALAPSARPVIAVPSAHRDPAHAAATQAADDPALPALREALDPASIEPALRGALGLPATAALAEPPRLRRHKPGRRALVEYRLSHRDGEPPLRLLAKLRARGADRRSAQLHQALHERGFVEHGPHGVRVPRALGLLPAQGLWLQSIEPGQPSTGLWLGPPAEAASRRRLAARIGLALAALHRHGPAGERPWTLEDEMAVLRRSLDSAAAGDPALAPRFAALAARCERLAAQLACQPSRIRCGLHRDFHPDQVLVDGESLVFVDLDLHAQGDPALDAGNFLAHLHELALRETGDAAHLAGEEATFRDAFLAASPAVDARTLDGWRTLALARLVALSRLRPGRAAVTEPLLGICHARLDAAEAEARLRDGPGQDGSEGGIGGTGRTSERRIVAPSDRGTSAKSRWPGPMLRETARGDTAPAPAVPAPPHPRVRRALLGLVALILPWIAAIEPAQAQDSGLRVAPPRWEVSRTAVFEAKREQNLDLERDRGDRPHVTEAEPLLRLGLRWRPGGAWSAFGETELLHKAERERGERTVNRARAVLNQAWLQHEGLVPGLQLRAGRWLQRDEREWLFDENLDGLRASVERERWSGELITSRANHFRRDLLNNAPRGGDVDAHGLIVRHDGRGDLLAAGWMLWIKDRDRQERRRHAGVRAHVDPKEDFSWRVDLSTVQGRADGERLRGWAFDVGTAWRLGDWRGRPRLMLGHARASGDADPGDGVRREHRQTGLQSNEAEQGGWGKFGIYGELLDPELRNLQITSLGLGFEPRQRMSLDLVWHHVRQVAIGPVDDLDVEIDPRGDRLDRAHLGDEIDLMFGWEPDDDRRLELVLGWFGPSDRLRADDEAGSPKAGQAWYGRVKLTWKF